MVNFKSFLENYELKELIPTRKIGSGNFADVYDTQNPNIVMRIERQKDLSNCDKFMMNPQVQATGGVAKIYGSKWINQKLLFPEQKDKDVFVTYKEKVHTNWYDILANKYKNILKEKYDIPKLLRMLPYGKETAQSHGNVAAFLQLALEAFRNKNSLIDFLNIFQEAKGIISAIRSGLPFDDLHSGNLGINSAGNLVVIDC